MKFISLSCFLFLVCFSKLSAFQSAAAEEFNGPFKTWANLKTQYGAKGDGKTDDSNAIQRAIDSLGIRENDTTVLFLPAGNYRITQTLNIKHKIAISLVGTHPDSVKIVWDGRSAGPMLLVNGLHSSKISRITWDGSGKALVALRFMWDGKKNKTSQNEFSDLILKGVAHGFRIGNISTHRAEDECKILRCEFIENYKSAICLQAANALDWFIWDSKFVRCKIGIENLRGNFFVYRSMFLQSDSSDIALNYAGYLSARFNFSKDSKAFLIAKNNSPLNVGVTLQGNTIISQSKEVLYYEHLGPLLIIDNTFKTGANPVVALKPKVFAKITSIGNISLHPIVSEDILGEKYVSDKILKDLIVREGDPRKSFLPEHKGRRTFEVEEGMTASDIQNQIEYLSKNFSGQKPIIHFGKNINIDKTLILPPNSDIQLIGDGIYTPAPTLKGSADIDILKIEGPSKITVKDLFLLQKDLNPGSGIVMERLDQKDSRIFAEQIMTTFIRSHGILIDKLQNTKVEFRNSTLGGNEVFVKVIGTGNPVDREESPVVAFYGGSANVYYKENGCQYVLENKGKLLLKDIWFEGWQPSKGFIKGEGNFTWDSGHFGHGVNTIIPAIFFENFSGKITLIGLAITKLKMAKQKPRFGFLGLGLISYFGDEFISVESKNSGNKIMIFNTVEKKNITSSFTTTTQKNDDMFLNTMLSDSRNIKPLEDFPLKSTQTDVRINRVRIEKALNGLVVK